MNATKIQVKLYSNNLRAKDAEHFVPVFHRWIRENVLDEMVIDVADYTHVPDGPGVVLVGHASDYYVDLSEGRPGVLYSRKRDVPSGADLVEDALRRALHTAKLLSLEESLEAKPEFSSDEILFRMPERIHLRNDEASFQTVKESLTLSLSRVFPERTFTLAREGDSRAPLTVRARAAL